MLATNLSMGHEAQPAPSSSDARVPMRAPDALALAKAHFAERGWRPVSIQSPLLDAQCRDASAALLMNDDGATAWLSARDWSALANPVDAFRREMVCVRAAKVQEAILVYDGEFPEAVIEVAAQEPGLKLVDAVALRAMRGATASRGVASGIQSRRQRFISPARNAVASLHAHATRAVDTRLLPATERFVSKRLVQTLRRMDGERRKLRNLVTGGLIVMGFAIGFLLFNLVILIRAPDDAVPPPVASTPRPALPAPLPPPQGYVAQVADAPVYVASVRPAILPRATATMAIADAGMRASSTLPDAVTTSATIPTGLDDFAVSQMRADEAMRVIADDTPEMRVSGHVVAAAAHEVVAPRAVPTGDPAKVDGEPAVQDPADIE